MIGCFWFFRRRRLLPFLAAYALVCINGATLVPFTVPTACSSAPADASADGLGQPHADAWRWLAYERGRGPEREPVVAAALPPIVKNLRRPAPSQPEKAGTAANESRIADVRIPRPEVMQRALVANGADLCRLCRLLL